MNGNTGLRPHLPILVALALLTGLLYGRLMGAYFCGFDDFIELNRAAFEDARDPSRIWTTAHYNSNRYRPLSRVMNDVTYWLGGSDPTIFRLRNLVSQWAAGVALYGLGMVLFGNRIVSGTAAALLIVHPLVNQTVVAASFYNTTANAEYIGSLALFIAAERGGSRRWGWLALAMLLAGVGLFTYDSGLMAFPLIALWLVWQSWRKRRWEPRFALATVAGSGLIVGLYVLLRVVFVSETFAKTAPISLAAAAKNLVLYAGGVTLPADLVAAHFWLDTPLPSQIRLSAGLLAAGLIGALAVGAALWTVRRRFAGMDPQPLLYLAVAIVVSLLPFLFFNEHASETYVYLPVAFLWLGVVALLWRALDGHRTAFAVMAVALGLNFAACSWTRTNLVMACGDIAERIVENLPDAGLREGKRDVLVAKVEDGPVPELYGIYGYRGLDTIGVGEYGLQSVGHIFRLRFQNPDLRVRVVLEDELAAACAAQPQAVCLTVSDTGSVRVIRQ